MARRQVTKAILELLKKNPEVAEELGKIGQALSKVATGKSTKVQPVVTTSAKTKPPKLTSGQKGKVRLYINPNTGKAYGKSVAEVRQGLKDIEAGTAVKKSEWKNFDKDQRESLTGIVSTPKKSRKKPTRKITTVTGTKPAYMRKTRTKKEIKAAVKDIPRKRKEKEEELAKRLNIKLSTTKEGTKKHKDDMQKVVNILGNETTNMRNLRQAGEKQRGGITGLLKSMEGPAVSSPYAPGGKFYRPPATHALPSQRTPDVSTGALKEEGRNLDEEVIKALNLPPHLRDKRLKQLELFYGRRLRSVFDPETKQPLGRQLISETKVLGDTALPRITGGRDITGRPLSLHKVEIPSETRDLIMSALRGRVPGLTKEQRQRITKDLWYKGESQLPKGLVDKHTGDNVIQWRVHPEYESRYPISTPGINEPVWNARTGQFENLTSQTRYRSDNPAYPKGVVAEEMGLRGDPGIRINPESIQGAAGQKAAITRPQALEHLPEAGYTPPHFKGRVPKFPAQRGSIDLGMAQRAEQTGALTHPLLRKPSGEQIRAGHDETLTAPMDVTQQRILENVARSRRAEGLTQLGEQEALRQAAMKARATGRSDPTSRTFDPTEPASPIETIRKVGRKKQTFVDYPTTTASKATKKQIATEKAKEKINREVIVIRAKKLEFNKLVENGFETPESLLKRKDYKTWDTKRKALKKTINKKYPEWQEYIPDAGGVPVWQGKYVDSFKKGAIIARKSGGQLKKPRGWGAARYR